MTVAPYLVAILGLAVLMVAHESGHYFAARKFGMRVVRFSIGFGPRIWRHKPPDSDTVYQVALIPFLAYVQIAGMNPYEESDPNDAGSYANASLWARIVTIAAGPLTNYFFASVLIFFGLLIGGKEVADEATHEGRRRGRPRAGGRRADGRSRPGGQRARRSHLGRAAQVGQRASGRGRSTCRSIATGRRCTRR